LSPKALGVLYLNAHISATKYVHFLSLFGTVQIYQSNPEGYSYMLYNIYKEETSIKCKLDNIDKRIEQEGMLYAKQHNAMRKRKENGEKKGIQ
jgi:hypothetical protein